METGDFRSVLWALCLTGLVTTPLFADEFDPAEPSAPPPKFEMIPIGGSSGPTPAPAPGPGDDANEEKSVLMKVTTQRGKIIRTEIVPDATPAAETPIESIPGPTEIEFQPMRPRPSPSPRPKNTAPLPHSRPSTSISALPPGAPTTHSSAAPSRSPSPSPSPKPAGPDAELLRLLRR